MRVSVLTALRKPFRRPGSAAGHGPPDLDLTTGLFRFDDPPESVAEASETDALIETGV